MLSKQDDLDRMKCEVQEDKKKVSAGMKSYCLRLDVCAWLQVVVAGGVGLYGCSGSGRGGRLFDEWIGNCAQVFFRRCERVEKGSKQEEKHWLHCIVNHPKNDTNSECLPEPVWELCWMFIKRDKVLADKPWSTEFAQSQKHLRSL